MASRKFKEYSKGLRKLVIKHFLSGFSDRDIAHKMLIPRTSIRYIISTYKSTKCIRNIIGCGRKRKITAHVDRSLRRKVMTNRRISSTRSKAELQSELNVAISESTIKRRAYEAGFFDRVVRKKLYVNKVNRSKRLEYARTYLEKLLDFWNRVI